jgi:hypothetical protein
MLVQDVIEGVAFWAEPEGGVDSPCGQAQGEQGGQCFGYQVAPAQSPLQSQGRVVFEFERLRGAVPLFPAEPDLRPFGQAPFLEQLLGAGDTLHKEALPPCAEDEARLTRQNSVLLQSESFRDSGSQPVEAPLDPAIFIGVVAEGIEDGAGERVERFMASGGAQLHQRDAVALRAALDASHSMLKAHSSGIGTLHCHRVRACR